MIDYVKVAAILFPDSVADGSDCKAEIGNEGNPCRYCAQRNRDWLDLVETVKQAIEDSRQ